MSATPDNTDSTDVEQTEERERFLDAVDGVRDVIEDRVNPVGDMRVVVHKDKTKFRIESFNIEGSGAVIYNLLLNKIEGEGFKFDFFYRYEEGSDSIWFKYTE